MSPSHSSIQHWAYIEHAEGRSDPEDTSGHKSTPGPSRTFTQSVYTLQIYVFPVQFAKIMSMRERSCFMRCKNLQDLRFEISQVFGFLIDGQFY